jgi:hypothetical protein
MKFPFTIAVFPGILVTVEDKTSLRMWLVAEAFTLALLAIMCSALTVAVLLA